jgi:hypothetical protein
LRAISAAISNDASIAAFDCDDLLRVLLINCSSLPLGAGLLMRCGCLGVAGKWKSHDR